MQPAARTLADRRSCARGRPQERHSQSTEKYRLTVVAEEYPKQLAYVCSDAHPGGALEFPTKRRPH